MGVIFDPELADRGKAFDPAARMLAHHPAIKLVAQDRATGTALGQAVLRRTLKRCALGLHQVRPGGTIAMLD